ncbi:hypothetical protein R3P38DRAFT_3190796 [Favolaschia claudopus]|uniref:F-box domain-containing protein n=1 Tax=Favolaschia claudopus TaxID=2862362 RepID=A0AAW0BM14_9AGAR
MPPAPSIHAFDMSDPAQAARAHDRFLAGICPTLGPQSKTKARRHAKAVPEKLTRDRLAREEAAKESVRRSKRLADLDYRRAHPRPPPRPKPTLARLAYENLQRSLSSPSSSAFPLDDPEINLNYFKNRLSVIFGGDPVALARWEEERRQTKEKAHADQARAIAEGRMRGVMVAIREVGAEKLALEKAEVGPAPIMGNLVARKPLATPTIILPHAEAIEAAWAAVPPITPAIAEMGPGKRREFLDDLDEGWRKKPENRAERRRRILEQRKEIDALYGFLISQCLSVHGKKRVFAVCEASRAFPIFGIVIDQKLTWTLTFEANATPTISRALSSYDTESTHDQKHSIIQSMMTRADQEQEDLHSRIRVLEQMIRYRAHYRNSTQMTASASARIRSDIRKWQRMIYELRRRSEMVNLTVSYDICCQFARNLAAREDTDPEVMEVIAYLISNALELRTSCTMPLPRIPDSCLREIARLLSADTQATAILVSRRFARITRPELYRVIEVEKNTASFFSALVLNTALGRLIEKLVLAGATNPCSSEELGAAVCTMTNLYSLHIHYSIDFLPLLRHFPGTLRDFMAWQHIPDDTALDFLVSQPSIVSAFFGDLNLERADASILPRLAKITARAEDLVVIVPSRPVHSVEFWYDAGDQALQPVVPLTFLSASTAAIVSLELQISQLFSGVDDPAELRSLLPEVRRLIIYQDKTWGGAFVSAANFEEGIGELITHIDKLSTLRHLVIASTYGYTEARWIRRKFISASSLRLDFFVVERIFLPLEASALRYIRSLEY